MLEIGSIVDGKYKILNKIGQGGMSVVYLAMNERANKQWAIKEIRKDGVSNYEVVKQGLIVETDLLKKLNHPHLPSIIDVIEGDGTFLIVMDYIEGNPLSKVLKHQGAQPQENVIEWAKQLCDVLGYLHSRQPPIVYRDMKPSNVMLKPDGSVTLIDFGTAREFKSTSVADTTCLGTQGYAAPEQFGGQGQTDGRTDIYCLGATMYHLVTGHNPAEPPYEMYPITQWNPNLSSGLEEIILKCTQKNPNDRYQSCAELMYALENYEELDKKTKKEYTKKWRLFLGSTVACMLSLAGTVGFKVAENSQIQGTYDYYIEKAVQATNGGELEGAKEYYQNAIELAPEKSEAYINLLENVLKKDGTLTKEESTFYSKLLTGTGKTENVDLLKESDPDSYDLLAYNLGVAYYYYYYEPTEGMNKAGKWYAIAAESKTLDDTRLLIAETLSDIISYSDKLNTSALRPDGQIEFSYTEYWNALVKLINIEYEELGSRAVSVKVYENFAANVRQYQSNFENEGITEKMMLEKIKIVYDKLLQVQQYENEGISDKNNGYMTTEQRQRFEDILESIEEYISELEKSVAKGKD